VKRCTILLALLFALGCSEAPAPIAAKKLEETGPTFAEIPDRETPAQSEPAAKAIVDAALAAHSEGKPNGIAAWKSFTLVRSGAIRTNTREIVNQTWTIHATWPDGYKLSADLGGNTIIVSVAGNTVRRAMMLGVQKTASETLDAANGDDFRKDTAGEWLWSLYPLTLPETKFAGFESTTFQGKKLLGVRVFHPNFVPVVAFFDPDTKLMTGVAYQGRENGIKVLKENYAIEMKTFAGLKFPGRLVVNANGIQLAEWNVAKLEQASYDAKHFDVP